MNEDDLDRARAFGNRECAARMEAQAELARLRAQVDEIKALARQVVENRRYLNDFLDPEGVDECVVSVLALLAKIDGMK